MPVIHGSGDFALAVRKWMLDHPLDCLAVPLPPSFQEEVERAIQFLPVPTMVVERPWAPPRPWRPEEDRDEDADDPMGDYSLGPPLNPERPISYVPIDPCQPVIAGLRTALGEHLPRAFIDLETDGFEPYATLVPDPYALKRVDPQRFAAAILPTIGPLPHAQARLRVAHMADRLRRLEKQFRSVLCLCAMSDWPWLRQAYQSIDSASLASEPNTATDAVETLAPVPSTLLFLLSELPFITGLYERARAELESDENLSIDGVKELLVTARSEYRADFKNRSRTITPHLLSTILKYVRNLTLLERRLTPDLFNLVTAAQQVAGDSYALHVAEQAATYPYVRSLEVPPVLLGMDRMRFENGDVFLNVSRLPGHPLVWRSLQLHPRPPKRDRQRWEQRWNPFVQCSWPPEDKKIEDFRAHVAERAKAILGMDLAKTQKFTTSVEDGIDIRETLRNWHSGDLYIKVQPPVHGRLDAVVMLFDSPADPRDYPWRSTWFAEHQNESTLAFFASDYKQEMVGPGIALGRYGGALFLFPPLVIPDVWTDRQLDFANTLEERLLTAACMYADCPHIALLSPAPPGAAWRKLAKKFKKKWVHVPLSSFSSSTVAQLQMVHVLNGHQVRSYAADFIRKA